MTSAFNCNSTKCNQLNFWSLSDHFWSNGTGRRSENLQCTHIHLYTIYFMQAELSTVQSQWMHWLSLRCEILYWKLATINWINFEMKIQRKSNKISEQMEKVFFALCTYTLSYRFIAPQSICSYIQCNMSKQKWESEEDRKPHIDPSKWE